MTNTAAKKIIVIGAGSWGTAIANLLAKNSHQVLLSANIKEVFDEITQESTNKNYLPDIKLSENLKAISSFEKEIQTADFVFIVVPSLNAAEVFNEISQAKINENCKFVICSKGVEKESLNLLGDAFENITNIKDHAVLAGPNFAIEVAQEIPTITTIAAKDKELANQVIAILNNDYFKAQYSNDPRTAEICAIVKNIIAIGCGITDGLGLGINAKSAVVMKGISEIQILCEAFNTSKDLTNAAGFGDIFLTCSSTKSRNNSLGVMIAKGKTHADIKKETNTTYEGAASAEAIAQIAKKYKLQLDLCDAIAKILAGDYSPTQIKDIITQSILS